MNCDYTTLAPQVPCLAPGSQSNHAVGFQDLPAGVLLTGTPTVEEQGSSDLTLSNKSINTSDKVVLGETYPSGTAVLFHRSGGVAGRDYIIKVSVTTDATPADVIVGWLRLTITRAPQRGIAQ